MARRLEPRKSWSTWFHDDVRKKYEETPRTVGFIDRNTEKGSDNVR